MNKIESGLRKLIDMGFQFLHPRNDDGAVVTVVGLRAHHDVVDLVQLYGEHDAFACRVSADEPDIFAPNELLWRHTGPAAGVIESMLALGDPEPHTAAAERAKGCWVPVRPGRSKWLALPA